MENLKMLSLAQLDQLAALPIEARETVRNMLLDMARQQTEEIAKVKNNTGIKYRVEPHAYVAQVMEQSPGLVSTLELIALAVDYMLPGCLTAAKDKHSNVFNDYSGVAFMQVIAATEVVKWKSVRDINGKMAVRLLTLDPNYVPNQEEVVVVESNVLDNLPIVQVPIVKEKEEIEDLEDDV